MWYHVHSKEAEEVEAEGGEAMRNEDPHVERNRYNLLDDLVEYVGATQACGSCPFILECTETKQTGKLCIEQKDILHDYLVEKYNL